MIAAGIFVIAGMIAAQNVITDPNDGRSGWFVLLTVGCWFVAALITTGAIHS